MASMSAVAGWYDLEWSGGKFEVCFRPAGTFFCPKFQAPAKWSMEGDMIKIDWAKFGKYEMKFNPDDKTMEGNAVPKKEDDPKNWRKAAFNRPLSAEEAVILGDGAGSEWDFEWSGGKFPVTFKADGYNHFQCDQFPAHAHWSLEGDQLKINWAEYGKYVLTVDAAAKTMSGSSEGAPEDWRKASFLRNKISDATLTVACDAHH
eukprot:TRINITY_DN12160_c0_g1_i1.p1 TRINITY_DN12160_c0_g1~~TRINITY_DN12160_c0_g1_i1.p1  ORF type:complete len:204 (+),score=46.73 TRINITY_DN12160_c0_g1_i1:54-665(+)